MPPWVGYGKDVLFWVHLPVLGTSKFNSWDNSVHKEEGVHLGSYFRGLAMYSFSESFCSEFVHRQWVSHAKKAKICATGQQGKTKRVRWISYVLIDPLHELLYADKPLLKRHFLKVLTEQIGPSIANLSYPNYSTENVDDKKHGWCLHLILFSHFLKDFPDLLYDSIKSHGYRICWGNIIFSPLKSCLSIQLPFKFGFVWS